MPRDRRVRKKIRRRNTLTELSRYVIASQQESVEPKVTSPMSETDVDAMSNSTGPGFLDLEKAYILTDPLTNSGLRLDPGRGESVLRAITTVLRREFSEVELPYVQTEISFDLPFRVTIDNKPFGTDDGVFLTFTSIERPIAETEARLGLLITNQPPHLTMEPDNWGISSFSRVQLLYPTRLEMPSPGKGETDLLKSVIIRINQFLVAYCLASGNYRLPLVSYGNVPRFTFRHLLNNQAFNVQSSYLMLPDTHLELEPPLTQDDPTLDQAISGLLTLSDQYRMAYGLLVEARRAVGMPNLWLATVEALAALEVCVFHFMETRLRADTSLGYTILRNQNGKGSSTAVKVNHATFNNQKHGITLNEALNQLLSQCLTNPPSDFDLILESCNVLRQKRNDAVHKPSEFDPRGLEELLLRVESLFDFLSGYQRRC